MNRIAIVTTTRAEYGLLTPLIRRVTEDDSLDLDLIVSGTHLSPKHGHTIDDIKKDGFEITHEIPILEDDNTAYGISITMSNSIKQFAKCFRDDRPDIVVILGDRTEMLGVACAALNELIPIAHIHGGELTEGAVDDCIRHSITKMSYLHFTSTEIYRKRVIQLGENPERVFNVGALGVENVLSRELLSEREVRENIGIPADLKYAVVTFHPATMESDLAEEQMKQLCAAMDEQTGFFYVITGSNADVNGDILNRYLQEFANTHNNAKFSYSLGMVRYLSAVKYASFVAGNSSSGIIEAPALGVPAVNIGDRQKGRIHDKTVIDCGHTKESIISAIEVVKNVGKSGFSDLYGSGDTSVKILKRIKETLRKDINLKKVFYDL